MKKAFFLFVILGIFFAQGCTNQAKISFVGKKYSDTVISTAAVIPDTGRTMYVSRKNHEPWRVNPSYNEYLFATDTTYVVDGDTITIAEAVVKEKF